MKNLAVVGSGYVGLVAGTMFASVGNRVTCIDKDPEIVSKLNSGQITIHEPGLEEILREAVQEGNLSFSTDTQAAVESADVSFLAVGTPSTRSGAYDFRYVFEAARDLGKALCGRPKHFVVIKSTITPDIYTSVQDILQKELAGSGTEIEVISNPEFLAEGTAVRDFRQPHRVIICHRHEARSQ
jgi:UDPglucose 6-dehydrogenase